MSRSRHFQIALTYTRPFLFRFWAAAACAFIVWLLCLREANFQVRCTMLLLGGTLAGWIGPMITAHAKEQLADARARLTPGFVAPHLLIAAVFLLIGVAGMTCFTTMRLHQLPTVLGWPTISVSQTGLLSVVLLATTLLVLMSHTQSPILIFAIVVATGFSITLGRSAHVRLVTGDFPAAAIVIIALCAAVLAGLWWRLGVMHEEMIEYWRTESFNNLRVRIAMTGDRHFRRAAAAETGWLTEQIRAAHRLDSLTNVFDGPFWQRVRRWRLVIGMGKASWPLSLLIAAFFMAIFLIFSDGTKSSDIGMLIILPTVLSLTGPIMGTGMIWPQRWFTLAGESLYPARSRATFLREHGAAMAMEMANLWVWFTVGALLTPLILRPGFVLNARSGQTLLLIAALQVWIFGASVWMLRLRTNWLINFLAILLIVTAAGNVVAWQVGGEALRTPSPLVTAGVLVVGVIVTADAYRRWLKTDLD